MLACIAVGLSLLSVVCLATPNLHIGTGGFGYGCGSNSPAAQLPYSFVRLGPDTSPANPRMYKKFQHYGGYHDSDHSVRAFSHMHLVGAGVMDMGVFGFLPLIAHNPSGLPQVLGDRVVAISKEDEIAYPGYYSVLLPGQKIKVELTSSQRCGAHRYTYVNVKNKPMDIHIMSSYLLDNKSPRFSHTQICGRNCVEGKVHVTGGFGGRFGGYNAHFHMQITGEEDGHNQIFLYQGNSIKYGLTEVEGNKSGAIFRTNSNFVQILVGISYVSIENARLNFEVEVKGKSFEQVRQESTKKWSQELGRFNIYAINEEIQTKIDTAVYRTLLTPTIFEDVNGQYVSFRNDGTKSVKPASMKHVYTDMSLWDVHRTQMPWILFHDPHRFADIAMSIVLINREGGYMPKWPFAQGPTGCMIGAHANTVLADWIVKEAHKSPLAYNISEVLNFMLRNANTQTPHDSRSTPSEYLNLGYIPFEKESRSSCSQTLQYSFNDFGISQVAKLLNQTQTHQQFVRRSKFYKNVFNNQTKFFQPKFKNGTFKQIKHLERINIFSNYYVEGDAWHYRFFAPHDANGLIGLFGGEKYFVKELNNFFSKSPSWPTLWLPNPYYWAGNEHNLFSVWLFPFANRSDLTQKYSRHIVKQTYGVTGSGLPGNDDYATMSAWLIFAAIGFYPLPSTTSYILGSPYIHYAKIIRKFNEVKTSTFRISVYNNSEHNLYARKIKLNRNEVYKSIVHQEIQGQENNLEYWMEQKSSISNIEQI